MIPTIIGPIPNHRWTGSSLSWFGLGPEELSAVTVGNLIKAHKMDLFISIVSIIVMKLNFVFFKLLYGETILSREPHYIILLFFKIQEPLAPIESIWRHSSWLRLVQVTARCMTTPSRHINYCRLIISDVFWHSREDNFAGNAQVSIHDMSLKFQLATYLTGQWAKFGSFWLIWHRCMPTRSLWYSPVSLQNGPI